MADDMKGREASPAPEVDGGGETPESRLADAENLLRERAAELAGAKTRIVQLEEALAGKDGEIAELGHSVAELEEGLSAAKGGLRDAVTSYRDLAVRSSPGMMEELVTGDSIAEIDESLARARGLIDRVRQSLEEEMSSTRVPAGATERRAPDLSGLSAREKIEYAIGGNR